MNKIVLAQFEYRNPRNGETYTVQRGWACKSHADAELTVRYYGMKTGALSAQCKVEEYTDEEIKQAASSTTTKEAHQA